MSIFFRVYSKDAIFANNQAKDYLVDMIQSDVKDVYIDESLEKGYKTLSFNIKATRADKLEEEGFIETKDYRYVIKEINKENNDYYSVYCNPDIERLQKNPLLNFASLTQTAFNTIALAIVGCGWNVIDNTTNNKKRTIRVSNGTSYEVIEDCRTVFDIEIEYDTINKDIIMWDKRGEDKGFFVTNEHDMSSFTLQSSTYDYYTIITPYGKDGLTIEDVNDGKKSLYNYSYSNKDLEFIWIDQRYTIAENLKEDAEAKLAEMATPKRTYACKMSALEKSGLALGDTIIFLDTIKKIKEKQRITAIKWTPLKPEETSITISNTSVSFTDQQSKLEKAATILENNVDDAGDIVVTTEAIVDTLPETINFNEINADKATFINQSVSDLNATQAVIGNLQVPEAEIGYAHITKAVIDNFDLGEAIIDKLKATQIDVDTINFNKANGGTIQATSIVNIGQYTGNLTADNFDAGAITSDKLSIEDGFITNAMIEDATITAAKILSIDAATITAGTIDTNRLLITDELGNSIIFSINVANNTPELSHTTIDGGAITDRTVTADKIVAGSITAKEIAAGTITGNNITSNTITSDKIQSGAITADKISPNSLTVGAMTDEMKNYIENASKGYVDEQLDYLRQDQAQYLGFSESTGLVIGSQTDGMQTQYTSDKIAFLNGGQEVASISNEELEIDKAVIKTSLKIGHYLFMPRTNGNLSLIWEE
jgi:phage minor structural protein